jgi:hypothetical protein
VRLRFASGGTHTEGGEDDRQRPRGFLDRRLLIGQPLAGLPDLRRRQRLPALRGIAQGTAPARPCAAGPDGVPGTSSGIVVGQSGSIAVGDCLAEPVALSDQPGASPARPSSAVTIAGLIAANASLIAAGLVYVGWAYTNAMWGYFHINPIDLGVGIPEYVLRSLSLFSPAIVIAGIVLVVATAARAWNLDLARFARTLKRAVPQLARLGSVQWVNSRLVLIGAGTVLTITALVLFWLVDRVGVNVSTYLILGLLGAGPLVISWPTRADRRGRFSYVLATMVAAICALWAASIYADSQGKLAAQSLARGSPSAPEVAVYSTQPLAPWGPGVTVRHLSADSRYHYLYLGFRLLFYRSGTYYLLPPGWSPERDYTFILNDTDNTAIALYSHAEPF